MISDADHEAMGADVPGDQCRDGTLDVLPGWSRGKIIVEKDGYGLFARACRVCYDTRMPSATNNNEW